MAKVIRQCDSFEAAIAGLSDSEGCFCQAPAIGDTVVNFGMVAMVGSFHPESGDPILMSLTNDEQWVASAEKVVALK